jgi:hypothetical protein
MTAADRARSGVAWADRQLARWRQSMTPGQRWTAALAAILALVVLTFGAPTRVVTVPGPGAPSAGALHDLDRGVR